MGEVSQQCKCHQVNKMFVTGCTASCQNDNIWCSQWNTIHQHDGISFSMYPKIKYTTRTRQTVCLLLPLTHLPPSATYMRQWPGSALVQIMACRLFGAKPLPQPVLTYQQLDPYEPISLKFKSQFKHYYSRKCIRRCRLRNGSYFVQEDMS